MLLKIRNFVRIPDSRVVQTNENFLNELQASVQQP